jgi:hypothetical protein
VLAAEVTAVDAVAVEVDQPIATRAPTSPGRKFVVVAAHAFIVGAAEPRRLISLDPKGAADE